MIVASNSPVTVEEDPWDGAILVIGTVGGFEIGTRKDVAARFRAFGESALADEVMSRSVTPGSLLTLQLSADGHHRWGPVVETDEIVT